MYVERAKSIPGIWVPKERIESGLAEEARVAFNRASTAYFLLLDAPVEVSPKRIEKARRRMDEAAEECKLHGVYTAA